MRNRAVRSQLRAGIKKLHSTTDKEEGMNQLREVSSMLDRAAAKNLIHKKTADRNKARFAKMVGKLAQG